MLLPFLLLCGTLVPPAHPWPVATTHRYRIELTIRSEVDLSGMGMPVQIQEQSAIGIVAVTLTDSAGGHALSARVDSATFNPGDLPLPADIAAQARGTTFHGFVDASGRVHGLTGSTDNPVSGMLQAVLEDFFPRAPREAGAQLTDTLNVISRPSGGSMATTTITQYTTGGIEEFHGVPATKISASFTLTLAGTVQTPGGEAGMKGTGSGTGNYYRMSDGTFLGGSRTTSQNSAVTMAMAPADIPVRTTTVLVVTPIP